MNLHLLAAPHNREDENFRHLVIDIIWFGLAFPAVYRFLSVYAIRLGADSTQLTWMASLPALVLLVTASFASRWMGRYRSSVRAMLWPGLGYRLIFLLPALTPIMPRSFQTTWIILCMVLPAIPQGLASVAFQVMFREAVSGERVPWLLSVRMMAVNAAIGVSGLAMGLWLERAPFPTNYSAIYMVAFVFALMSLGEVMRVRVRQDEAPAKTAQPEVSRTNPWRSRAFLAVAAVLVLSHITFFGVLPLVPLHLVKGLGATESFMGLFALAELTAGAVIAVAARTIVDYIGNRGMVGAAMIGTAASVFIVATTTSLPMTLVAAAVGGASWTLVGIGLFAYFSESTPYEEKTAYTTAYNQVTFAAMFIGPLLGRALSQDTSSLVVVLLIGAGTRLLAGVLIQMHPLRWYQRKHQLVSSIQ